MSFYYKYRKYKTKYLELKRITNEKKLKFYFVHTTNYDNLLAILRKGKILPGKDVNKKRRHLSGTPLDNVYGNIYFDDLNNLDVNYYMLLLHPKIIYEDGFEFHRLWSIDEETGIIVNGNENPEELEEKIEKIHDFVANPHKYLPHLFENYPKMYTHQILFDHPIDLVNGNLIGIVCYTCDGEKDSGLIQT